MKQTQILVFFRLVNSNLLIYASVKNTVIAEQSFVGFTFYASLISSNKIAKMAVKDRNEKATTFH